MLAVQQQNISMNPIIHQTRKAFMMLSKELEDARKNVDMWCTQEHQHLDELSQHHQQHFEDKQGLY